MPTVTFNRRIVEKILGRPIDDEILKQRISFLGTDLEKVDDNEIIVEIFPNRPDMLSEYGFARALSTFMGIGAGMKEYSAVSSGKKVIVSRDVGRVRPYTVCAIVKNLRLGDEQIREIIQLQEKLHVTFCRNRKKAAIGIYPLDKIEFPIIYTAKKPSEIIFRPLDAAVEMTAMQILNTHQTGKEYGHLLAGQKAFPVFIDANNEVLSIPPIINSEKTGRIIEETKDVFIECSGFNIDNLDNLLAILVTSLADMGGQIYSIDVEYEGQTISTPKLAPRKMKIDYDYINKWLGLNLVQEEIIRCLEMMGFGTVDGHAWVPPYRSDILHQVDLAEDVAIAYGYENFAEEIPHVATIASEDKLLKFTNIVSEIIVGLGAQEVNTYHLTNKALQCKAMNCEIDVIELENALTSDYNALRAWIMPQILAILSQNKTREFPQVLFDTGTIFKRSSDTETGVLENTRLAILSSHPKADFSEAKEKLDYLMRMLGMKYELAQESHPSFIPGRVGRIIASGKKIGYAGELHPIVLENFGIEIPVTGFEINLSEMFDLISKS